jgi:4-amino-4-deoxy-L-arabinose transferase-like glycosyltransferase
LTARLQRAGADRARLVEIAVLLALVAVAIVLRFYDLDRYGVRGDEAIYSGQASTLAGDPERSLYFAVFRAHPLLYQSVLAVLYGAGMPDMAGRWLVAGFGVAAVLVSWLLGRAIGGRWLGLIAGAVIAVAPYAVSMSRMALLDTTTGVLLGLSVWAAVRYLDHPRLVWLTASGGLMALACLTKEVAGVALLGLLLSQIDPRLRIGWRPFAIWTGTFVVIGMAYPASLVLGHGVRAAYAFLRWQLSGRGLAPADTYIAFVHVYLGWAVAIVFVVGLAASLIWPRSRERLLALIAIVVMAFLQYWRLKEVQLPVIVFPVLAVIAAIGFVRIGEGTAWVFDRVRQWAMARGATDQQAMSGARRPSRATVAALVTLALVLFVTIPMTYRSWVAINAIPDVKLSPGRGGYPGQLEAAEWFRDNAPDGSVCAVAAANLAALVQFYSGHECVGLNVPGNARRRNPVDVYVDNAAEWVESNRIHYVITDIISEQARSTLTDELNALIATYHGRLIHQVDGQIRQGNGAPYDSWLVRIYEVRP